MMQLKPVAESISNLLAAPIALDRVKLSANWMAACGEPGEDAALYATVRTVALELCPALGISIPVGKDSLSMRTQWRDADGAKKVVAPVSLIVSAFATLTDVRATLTPQLNAEEDSTLVLIDLGRGQHRLNGSILAQSGATVPDLDDPQDLINLVKAINALRAANQILAYHDRSDGGLLATVATLHAQPERTLRSPPELGRGAGLTQHFPLRHGGHAPAHCRGATRGAG